MNSIQNNNVVNGIDVQVWHRTLCEVTPWLVISGDLPFKLNEARVKLNEWVDAGVTDIVDLREEWSDEDFVREEAPDITYHYMGTHDNGTHQSAKLFERGIKAMRAARKNENAKLMVHCHMGINRGPSMAFAMLLDDGYGVVEALDMIRNARPIAGIIYADDAIRAVGKMHGRDNDDIIEDVWRAQDWFELNEISISNIIRRIRQQGEEE